jgi:Protein of unknown function (DUF3455)
MKGVFRRSVAWRSCYFLDCCYCATVTRILAKQFSLRYIEWLPQIVGNLKFFLLELIMSKKVTSSPLAAFSVTSGFALLLSCFSPAVAMADSAPDAVKVPAGNKMVLKTTTSSGRLTYQCREKKDAPGELVWTFAGPEATLNDESGKQVGIYFGPPATWGGNDGSKITGDQLAVSPGGAGNIALQLVKANPASAPGIMEGVTYVQRLATKGGVPPSSPCNADNKDRKEIVDYSADYLFWKAS